MVTGLTAELDDNKLSTQRWVLESLALQCFGTFYDTTFGRTEEQLEKAIMNDSGATYYIEKYENTKKRQKMTANWTLKEWKLEYDRMIEDQTQQSVDSVKRCGLLKVRHDAVFAELEKLSANSKDQFVKDIAKMGMQQLTLVQSETIPYIAKIPTLEEYAKEQIHCIKRDLDYYSEESEERKRRVEEALAQYQLLRNEVHRILDPPKE